MSPCGTLRGMTDDVPTWLTRAEAAAHLKISTRTLSRWVEHGRCPVHRTPSGEPRWRLDELDALMTSDPPARAARRTQALL